MEHGHARKGLAFIGIVIALTPWGILVGVLFVTVMDRSCALLLDKNLPELRQQACSLGFWPGLLDRHPVNDIAPTGILFEGALILNGTSYPVVERFAGSLEDAHIDHTNLQIFGWAIDQEANAPVIITVAVFGDTVVAVSPPAIRRPDVEAFASGGNPAGFVLNVPPAADDTDTFVQVYAILNDNTAVRLVSQLAAATEGRVEDFSLSPSP